MVPGACSWLKALMRRILCQEDFKEGAANPSLKFPLLTLILLSSFLVFG
jgi:hypothetical protein